jgi:hypothetical protein
VGNTYFQLLRVSLTQGRIWDETENRNATNLAVVNQTLARRYFPNGDAIGHSLKIPELVQQPPFVLDGPRTDGSWFTIVGIVGDRRNNGMRDPVLPEVSVPKYRRSDCSIRSLRKSTPLIPINSSIATCAISNT